MITQYIKKAMGRACVERLEDGSYFATIPGFKGPWAFGRTRAGALRQLRSVFEEWLVFALRDNDELPEMEGVSLNFGGKRWSGRPAAVSSSES